MQEIELVFTVVTEDGIDPEEVAEALNTVLDTALNTSGVLDEVGNPTVGAILVQQIREVPNDD